MSLRRKMLTIFGFVLVALILVLYVVSVRVMLNSAYRIERSEALEDLTRLSDAIYDAETTLDDTVRDYAAWDDIYRFMQGRNRNFLNVHIVDQSLINLHLESVIGIDSHGKVVLRRGYDLRHHRQTLPHRALIDFVTSKSVSERLTSPDSAISGIISLPDHRAFIAIRPVLTSQGIGPVQGYLAMVRPLDTYELSKIRKLAGVNIGIYPFPVEKSGTMYSGMERLKNGRYWLDRIDDYNMFGYAIIQGLDGRSVAVETPMKRSIYSQSVTSARYLILAITLAAIVFAILMFLILEMAVLRRVAHLSSSVKHVGASGELSSRIFLPGHDELSYLARVINRTVTALERSRSRLQEANEELDLRVRERTDELTKVVEELNTSKEEYRLLVDNQNDMIVMYDSDMNRCFASPSYCEMFGISNEEFLNNSFEFRVHDDDLKCWDEALEQLFGREHACYMEQRSLTKYGWRCLAWSGKAVLDDSGNVTAIICVGRDITEQKQAEESLRESQSVLRALMACIPEGIVVVDSQKLKVRAISSYAADLLRTPVLPGEDRIANSHTDEWVLLHSDGKIPGALEELPLTRAAWVGETITDEEWILHFRNADDIRILCNAGPIRDPDGNVTGGVLAFRDIRSLYEERERLHQAYVRERHIAEVLQHALMPVLLVNPPGYRIAARYSPALAEAQIGGDFYDVFHLADGKIAIAMGDIAGKGLQAAVHTAMAKYMIRAYAHLNSDPASVLARVNNAMCEFTPDELFVTIFYGVLDPDAHSFVYANGGHDQPLFYSKSHDSILALDTTGRIVGVLKDAEYGSYMISFDAGDYLVLYTDGITDSGKDGMYLGMGGLMEMLAESHHDDPSDITDSILVAALRASDNKLRDDAAVLVIKAEDQDGSRLSSELIATPDFEGIYPSEYCDDDPSMYCHTDPASDIVILSE